MELSLMLIIVDEEHTDKVTRFMREHCARFQFVTQGFGTANSELLALLGLGESNKSVISSLLPKPHADAFLRYMPTRVTLGKRTKGLMATVPLTGVTNMLFGKLSQEGMLNDMETEQASIAGQPIAEPPHITPAHDEIVKHELVIALVNEDSSEEVMETAKAAGAAGGTVVNGRRVGLDEDDTFMGMPIQVKKEIIFILTDKNKKLPIMKAINSKFGLTTPTHGLVFSIPVDSVAWLE